MSKFFVTQGSVYNPGWQVVENVSANHQVVRANMGTEDWSKAEAEGFLAALERDDAKERAEKFFAQQAASNKARAELGLD